MSKLTSTLSAVALTLAVAGNAQAVPLSDLLAGGSLIAGDKLFDQWEVTFVGASDPTFVFDFDEVEVTPLDDGGMDPGPGVNIDFAGEMTVNGDGVYAYRDITLGFRVSTLGGELIVDNSLTFHPSNQMFLLPDGTNDLGMFVEEWVYDALGVEIGHTSIEFSVLGADGTADYPDEADFAPQSQVFVVKNLLVWAVDDTDTAHLRGVEQRFSQIPEPATLTLLGLGLAGLGFARARRAKAA